MSNALLANDIEMPHELLIEWSEDLSVGIQEIDEQHKVLVNLLNRLHEAIIHHHAQETAVEIMNQLCEYTKIHFTVEESLMRILGYPDYDDHKEHHGLLIKQVQQLRQKLEKSGTSISFELLHFLKVWLTKHIMEEDMLYTPHFIKSGVKTTFEKKSWLNRFWHNVHN